MEITASEFSTIEDAVWDATGEPAEMTATYSGRGMYGTKCVGIVVDGEGSMFGIGARLSQLDEDLAARLTETSLRSDSMGLSVIYYWPQVSCPERAETEFDDDDYDEDYSYDEDE